jgi:membrane fusion protein, multidrug efflux system
LARAREALGMTKVGITALAALVVVAAAALLKMYEPAAPPTPAAPAASATPAARADAPRPVAPGVPVTAGTVGVADVPVFLNAIGAVQAYNMVTIKSRVDGQIVKLAFSEGQDVKAGAPLLEIDPRPFQAVLEQAQATKQKDEAQLASAQADMTRSASLVGSGYRAVQTYDQQKALVAQLQAAIKGDEAQINNARLNLGYADIRAPISGRLGARLVDAGNMVRATDGTGLVTITQLKPVFVSFTLAQDNIDQIREHQAKAPLVVQAYSGDNKTLLGEGTLTLIDNVIDQTTGTIRLKATFANEDERLWPGRFVNARVVLTIRKGVMTVPAQTVQDGPTGHYAYVIKSDDTVERRNVEVTAVQDGIAVVTKGLSAGDKVVVEGQYRLTQGARVRVSAPAPGAAG